MLLTQVKEYVLILVNADKQYVAWPWGEQLLHSVEVDKVIEVYSWSG